ISFSEANGVKTLKITLAKEVVDKNNSAANVHNGFYLGDSDLSSVEDDMSDFSSSFGPAVITMTINSDYTLNTLNVNSPLELTTSMKMDESDEAGASGTDIKFDATMVGSSKYDYKFTR
ncbi:MAG: hypothetical protein NC110_06860, partial [Ruminococcus sp.]|nr:hypothetical protein [Ruminococcus sp.]